MNWYKYNAKLIKQGKLSPEREQMIHELEEMRSGCHTGGKEEDPPWHSYYDKLSTTLKGRGINREWKEALSGLKGRKTPENTNFLAQKVWKSTENGVKSIKKD